ncbi:MAG: hypothetical protein U0359_02545 [Byssovorax sp.]
MSPSPPIVRELLKLKRDRYLSDRATGRVDAASKLFKSMEGREPSISALLEATRIVANAGAPPESATSSQPT